MHNANEYSETSENLEILKGPAQELRGIVSTRLPALYRSAFRLLGNTADAEDAVQMLFSPPTNIWTSFRDGRKCLRG